MQSWMQRWCCLIHYQNQTMQLNQHQWVSFVCKLSGKISLLGGRPVAVINGASAADDLVGSPGFALGAPIQP
eukprot:7598948-Ditylum_brightwellii.AAC.2